MANELKSSDPIRAYQRKAEAARRVGENAHCACGEHRPEALMRNGESVICAACQRAERRQTRMDKHHIAGRANSPVTLTVPVNDHRARLSVAQYNWPRATLQNPDGSPLLKAAASIRGTCDTILYLIETFLLWIAEMLESLDAYLDGSLGHRWWINTEFEPFAVRVTSDVER